MFSRSKIHKVIRPRSVRLSRADQICRRASKGKKSFTDVQREPVHFSPRPSSVLCRGSWFGSSGKSVGYTPKGVKVVLANQPAAIFRPGIVAGIIQHYEMRFKCIQVKRACQILNKIGSGDDIFNWICSNGNKRYSWTPNKMLKYLDSSRYASTIFPIDFIGGPPNKWGAYRGSLYTFLLDRIAVVVLFEGLKALDGVINSTERYPKIT